MDKRFVFIAVGITGLIFILLQSDFIQRKSKNILIKSISTTTITTTTKPQLAIDLGKALFPWLTAVFLTEVIRQQLNIDFIKQQLG